MSVVRDRTILSIELLQETEHRLVELKARVDDLNIIRKKLFALGAQYTGTYQQIDYYFEVARGRLKLREVKEDSESKLIYYERANVAGPKGSSVYILRIRNTEFFKALLKTTLKTWITVHKVREIHQHKGTRIHLDTVKKLGTYIEFEREFYIDRGSIPREDLQILEELAEKIGISPENLEPLSYSDLLLQTPISNS